MQHHTILKSGEAEVTGCTHYKDASVICIGANGVDITISDVGKISFGGFLRY